MSNIKEQSGHIWMNSNDPTVNVQNVVAGVVKRIDDLREAEALRLDQRYFAGEKRVNELMELRAEHNKELMIAESKRIDAIRVVDVASVSIANEKATAQATVLANQVATSAETLRTLVATTAAATATQLDQLTKQLTDRLALLEKAQYEGAGKQTVADPRLADLFTEMGRIRVSLSEGTGRSAGFNLSWGYLIGFAGVVATIVTVLTRFVK